MSVEKAMQFTKTVMFTEQTFSKAAALGFSVYSVGYSIVSALAWFCIVFTL